MASQKDKIISPQRYIELKNLVRAECKRRRYVGSVESYSGIQYDYVNEPAEDNIIYTEHFSKNNIPLRAINTSDMPSTEDNRVITDEDMLVLETKVAAFSARPIVSGRPGSWTPSDCSSSCTGTCTTSCTTGCTDGCDGGCDGGCLGCGGVCSETCTNACGRSGCVGSCDSSCYGSCRANCYEGCDTGCGDRCSGSCIESCGNCGNDCGDTCGTGCTTMSTS